MNEQPPQAVIINQVTNSNRGIGTLSHIIGPFGIFIGGLGLFIPLIIWLIKTNDYQQTDPLLESHLRESANASLTFFFAGIVHSILIFVFFIGCFTIAVHWLLYLIWAINANSALKAGQGYQYPFTIHIL